YISEKEVPTPPVRPWSLFVAYKGLKEEDFYNLSTDPTQIIALPMQTYVDQQGQTHEIFTGENAPLLRPQIMCASFLLSEQGLLCRDDKTLSLFGNFGSQYGLVTLDGNELPILCWDTPFQVSLPDDDVGNLIVTVDGIESNPVPITRWDTSFMLTPGPGRPDLIGTITLSLSFRADVHPIRIKPTDMPTYWGTGLQSVPIIKTLSKGTYNLQGSRTEGDWLVSYSGSGSISPWECNDTMTGVEGYMTLLGSPANRIAYIEADGRIVLPGTRHNIKTGETIIHEENISCGIFGEATFDDQYQLIPVTHEQDSEAAFTYNWSSEVVNPPSENTPG
ncbi:MAG TPA: hypothetical protein PLI09_28985, partial [Candidatus Hydrogenedentes bacterium]|nr:hypothetical protein [Candidatus Hydrogenedentota bacterium]